MVRITLITGTDPEGEAGENKVWPQAMADFRTKPIFVLISIVTNNTSSPTLCTSNK
jgi:hypothetical protein